MAANTLYDLLTPAPPGRTAVIIPEQNLHISYGNLRSQVEAVAGQLAAAGVRHGDRVGIALPNGLPTIVAFLAASLAGTAAPLNAGYKEEEFRFYLEDTNAKVLLLPPDGVDEARRAAGDRIPVLGVEMDSTGTVSLSGAPKGQAVPAGPDDVALILHTSGSTGRPKRVPLSHRNLTISAGNVARSYELTQDDVSLCVMPLFHVHGLVASTLATLSTGGTVVVPGEVQPAVVLARGEGARRHVVLGRADAAPAAPGAGRCRAPDRLPGAERLRFIRSCSASLPPQVMHDLEAAFGAPVLEAYGMTEAAHQMSSNPLPPAARKPGSVGRGTDVRISIMDASGTHLPAGERGEVVIQGPNVTAGYENNPEANATSFVDGWFRTGDQGVLDAEGYLTLVGRLKEMINRGGEKIGPREIDEVLLAHPAVAEAVCFGVPHPTWGEEVSAAVVLSSPATEAELLAFCRERLADFKRPKQIHITDTIPRTATGKIQRRVVAEAFAAKHS